MLHFIRLGVVLSLMAFVQTLPHPSDITATTSKQTYDNKFDNINIDEILGQERLLNNYIKCLEGLGPCTPDGKMLKETLPDAITTNCAKCTKRQKYGSDKVTHHLIDNRPEDWARLEKIYDPEGSYRNAYLKQKENNTEVENSSKNE